MKKIGMIGVGHMGRALLEGLLDKGLTQPGFIEPKNMFISGGSSDKARKLAESTGCHFCKTNVDLAKQCDVVILAVSPAVLPHVLDEIKSSVQENALVISLAASFNITRIQEVLGKSVAIARAIPNIPVSVCQGVTSISVAPGIDESHTQRLTQLFESVGKVLFIEEKKLDTAIAISGCSPAFAALFIEAMADAGVYAGLSREEAYLLSEQAVLGTAATLLKKKMLPAEFKDMVCTPGGITIKGIAALEAHGLRNAVIEAVKVSAGK